MPMSVPECHLQRKQQVLPAVPLCDYFKFMLYDRQERKFMVETYLIVPMYSWECSNEQVAYNSAMVRNN